MKIDVRWNTESSYLGSEWLAVMSHATSCRTRAHGISANTGRGGPKGEWTRREWVDMSRTMVMIWQSVSGPRRAFRFPHRQSNVIYLCSVAFFQRISVISNIDCSWYENWSNGTSSKEYAFWFICFGFRFDEVLLSVSPILELEMTKWHLMHWTFEKTWVHSAIYFVNVRLIRTVPPFYGSLEDVLLQIKYWKITFLLSLAAFLFAPVYSVIKWN